jgi:hypothetical protein
MALSPTRRLRTHARAAVLALTLAVTGASTALATPGTSGTSGTSGASDAAGSAARSDCTAEYNCWDFEDQTGTEPSGDWGVETGDCADEGAVSIDSEVAHSGSKSVRVDGAAGECAAAFARVDIAEVGLPDAGPSLYVRFWVLSSTPLPAERVTFAAMHDANSPDGTDLRLGGEHEVLQWHREADDATLPGNSPTGIELSDPLPANEWTCVESRIDLDWAATETWLNGHSHSIKGLTADNTPTPGIDQKWWASDPEEPLPSDLRLGWESHGEATNTLWFDDIDYTADRQRQWCE